MKQKTKNIWTLVRIGSLLLGLGILLVVLNGAYETKDIKWMFLGFVRVFYVGIISILAGNILIIVGIYRKVKSGVVKRK